MDRRSSRVFCQHFIVTDVVTDFVGRNILLDIIFHGFLRIFGHLGHILILGQVEILFLV